MISCPSMKGLSFPRPLPTPALPLSRLPISKRSYLNTRSLEIIVQCVRLCICAQIPEHLRSRLALSMSPTLYFPFFHLCHPVYRFTCQIFHAGPTRPHSAAPHELQRLEETVPPCPYRMGGVVQLTNSSLYPAATPLVAHETICFPLR